VSLFDAYKVKGSTWTKLGGFASNAFDISPTDSVIADEEGKILPAAHFGIVSETVGVDDQGVVALEGSNLLTVPITAAGWESSREPIAVRWSDGELPSDSLWFGLSAGTAWWWDGNVLMAQDRKGGHSVAYLPWNDPDAAVRGLATDGEGLWIATTVGVRRLDPRHADPTLGYGGFVRANLGKDAGRATTVEQKAVEQALWKWRLAPADEAGQDGGVMISGVFAGLGLSVPRKSSDLSSSKAGIPVRDELQFGDVLIFRRGAAIYLGDGKTAELQRGFVRNATIWPRSTAIVRRFVSAPKQ
jgi:hypothetical protein